VELPAGVLWLTDMCAVLRAAGTVSHHPELATPRTPSELRIINAFPYSSHDHSGGAHCYKVHQQLDVDRRVLKSGRPYSRRPALGRGTRQSL
jgi:hypothetical protein